MKSTLKKFFLIVISAISLFGACPDCGNKLSSCSARSNITFPSSNSLTISDKVKYWVRRNCCGGYTTRCCRNDYYAITNVPSGEYRLTVTTSSNKKLTIKVGSSCRNVDSSRPRYVNATIRSREDFTFEIDDTDNDTTIYIRAIGVSGEGLTDYSITLRKLSSNSSEESETVYREGFRNFEIINPDGSNDTEDTQNITGDFLISGNTLECVTTSTTRFDAPCTNDHRYNDNARMVKYIDIDNDPNTWNSSSAYLKLPEDFKEFVWAALFWQGNVNNIYTDNHDTPQRRAYKTDRGYSYHYITSNSALSPIYPEDTDANKVLFRIDGLTNYQTITAKTLDYDRWGYDVYGFIYSAYQEVTDIFKNINNRVSPGDKLTLTVANLTANEGHEPWLGNFGAWAFVAIYKSTDGNKFKRVLIYNGFISLDDPRDKDGELITENINITNLYLPRFGDVNAKFATFAGEGEETYHPDHMRLEGQNMPGARDPNNIFDARIANIERPNIGNNNVENTNGIDIDVYDVSSIMTQRRDEDPNLDTVTLTLDTDWDTYYPSMIAFSVDLYRPKICYLETLYDSNGTEIGENPEIRVGDTLTAHLTIRNDDNEYAENVEIRKIFDLNSTNYNENSVKVKDVDWDRSQLISDGSSYQGVNVNYDRDAQLLKIYYLGSGNPPIFHPYSESNQIATIDYNFTVTSTNPYEPIYNTSYKFHIAGREYTFNGQLPKCEDFNNTIIPYRPPLGSFNVVNSNFSGNVDPTDTNDPLNALYTAVVDQNYTVKVLHLDNDLTHLTPMTGAVFLEVVDATNINPSDNSCEVAPTIYKLPGKDYTVNFGLTDGQKSSQITLDTKILKIAKNATFRIRYIDWPSLFNEKIYPCIDINSKNGNLKGVPICVTTTTQINYLFPNTPCLKSQTGAPCNPSNRGSGNDPYDHEFGCLECLTDFHGSVVCARDNFAIRPYGFVAFADNYLKRSGEDINITIKAVNEGNFTLAAGNKDSVIGLKDYNESISNLDLNATIYVPTTSEIITMNQDVYGISSNDPSTVANCPSRGRFTVDPDNFEDGEVNATVQFDETGVITLEVSEKPGHEFALVDADDTPDTQRYIRKSVKITDPHDISKDNLMIFIPYQITTTATVSTTTGRNWLYITNDVNSSYENNVTPSMAAYVTYTIEAQNKAGNRVQNFTKTCFPDTDETNAPRRNGLKLNSTFDLFLDLWIRPDRNATLYFYTEDNTSNAIGTLTPVALLEKDKNNSIQEWISPLQFENGKGEAKVYFSIERNTSKPVNPISLTIVDANTSTSWMSNRGATNKFIGSNINQTYYFYYARLHIPKQGIEGNNGDVKAYYEIYIDGAGSDPAGIKGRESIDDVDWYINSAHSFIDGNITTAAGSSIDPKIKLLQKKAIANGEQNLTFQYLGNVYPYAKTFQIDTQPWLVFDKYNQTATKAKGRVIFKRAGGWLGRGNRDFTQDTNVPAPKEENDRILW